jgi:predicted phosphoribosyltransferase
MKLEPEAQLRFFDRQDAGRRLGAALSHLANERPVVLGLPRGGVVVAAEVAKALEAPLDVIVVRKLGVPGHEELAMGAVAEGGAMVLNDDLVRRLGIGRADLDAVRLREEAEMERRLAAFRGHRAALDLTNRTVIVVDDGIATGSTARAALEDVRRRRAARVVLAVPVGAAESLASMETAADEVVSLLRPTELWAVGQWYRDFSQTSDHEVVALLDQSATR